MIRCNMIRCYATQCDDMLNTALHWTVREMQTRREQGCRNCKTDKNSNKYRNNNSDMCHVTYVTCCTLVRTVRPLFCMYDTAARDTVPLTAYRFGHLWPMRVTRRQRRTMVYDRIGSDWIVYNEMEIE